MTIKKFISELRKVFNVELIGDYGTMLQYNISSIDHENIMLQIERVAEKWSYTLYSGGYTHYALDCKPINEYAVASSVDGEIGDLFEDIIATLNNYGTMINQTNEKAITSREHCMHLLARLSGKYARSENAMPTLATLRRAYNHYHAKRFDDLTLG